MSGADDTALPVAVEMSTGRIHYEGDGPVPPGWQRIVGLQGRLIPESVYSNANCRYYLIEGSGRRVRILGRPDIPLVSVSIAEEPGGDDEAPRPAPPRRELLPAEVVATQEPAPVVPEVEPTPGELAAFQKEQEEAIERDRLGEEFLEAQRRKRGAK